MGLVGFQRGTSLHLAGTYSRRLVTDAGGSGTSTISGTNGQDIGFSWYSTPQRPDYPAHDSQAATEHYPALADPWYYEGVAREAIVLTLTRSASGGALWHDESPTGYGMPFIYLADFPSGKTTLAEWLDHLPSPLPSDAVPLGYPATATGGPTVREPVRPGSPPGADIVTGLYEYAPNGWQTGFAVLGYDGIAVHFNYPSGASGITGAPNQDKTWTIHWSLDYHHWQEVYSDTDDPYPPEDDEDLSPYGLSMDLTALGGVRQVYNQGFNSETLRLRSRDDDGAFTDALLPFTGRTPEVLCLSDGRLWVIREAGGQILASRSDDDGGTWT